MPRIRNSASDPLDFCRRCFPKDEGTARKLYAGKHLGPDGRGDCFCYDDEHPQYEETDYRCVKCGQELNLFDN